MNKIAATLSVLAALTFLLACGKVEIGIEESVDLTDAVIVTEDATTVTAMDLSTPVATEATVAIELPEVEVSTPAPQPVETMIPEDRADKTDEWVYYINDAFGISFSHPAEFQVEVREPASPTAWNPQIPDGVTEEQLAVLAVVKDGNGAGPVQFLELKLVAKDTERQVGELAELFSLRCPDQLTEPIEETMYAPRLTGYRYSCQGMMVFTEFWAPYGNHPNVLFGAVWADSFSPVVEEILSTVSLSEELALAVLARLH